MICKLPFIAAQSSPVRDLSSVWFGLWSLPPTSSLTCSVSLAQAARATFSK